MWNPTSVKRLAWHFSDPLQVTLIMLGAGINLSIGFGLVLSSLSAVIASQFGVLFTSGISNQVLVLAVSYFLVGSLYSTVASLFQRPKRIINPLYIQLVTSSFVSILTFYTVIMLKPSITFLNASTFSFGVFLLALSMLGSAGFGQLLLVRYIVGLNGTKEDTHSSTILLNAKVKDVMDVLDTDEVHTAFRIWLERTRKGKLKVFRTSYNSPEQFYLLVMEDPEDSEKTQLATVSYRLGFFEISAGETELLDEMRSEGLRRIFRREGITILEGDASEALATAYGYALEPTKTKLLSLRSFEPHVRWVSAGILAMFFLVSGLAYFGLLPLDLYETFLIFFGFSLLFDFLPMLRRRRDRKPE